MMDKYILKNKKKFHGLFTQIPHLRHEIFTYIKRNKINEIYFIARLIERPSDKKNEHCFKFIIDVEGNNKRLTAFVIKHMKIAVPLSDDAIWKLNNMQEFLDYNLIFLRNEYERYKVKFKVHDLKINIINEIDIDKT